MESNVAFSTKEHIVPESLGNDKDILEDHVCDKCQNYFGTEIENFVLSKSPIGFWRTLCGIKNKKGKSPFFDQSQRPCERGKISSYHPITDNGIIIKPGYIRDELIIEADINDPFLLDVIQMNNKTSVKMVLTPKILVYLGRFLGKMALEYWCKNFDNDVYSSRFDALRYYVRYGTTNEMWPILHWQLPYNFSKYYYMSPDTQERTLYRYAFGETRDTRHVLFVFDIGCERYVIIINEKYPDPNQLSAEYIGNIFDDVEGPPNLFYYSSLS